MAAVPHGDSMQGEKLFRRRQGTKYMDADEIESILRIQWKSLHSGSPYFEDYYYQVWHPLNPKPSNCAHADCVIESTTSKRTLPSLSASLGDGLSENHGEVQAGIDGTSNIFETRANLPEIMGASHQIQGVLAGFFTL